jgi:uncharacterized protein YciI
MKIWLQSMVAAGVLASGLALSTGAAAQSAPPVAFDSEMARSTGADERGMKAFVLVILKTGPAKVAAGPARDEMFKGHFANINRLAEERKLVLAGPLDGVDGWRGLYVFAVADIEEAKKYVGTDPVVVQGEMVAEYHKYYGTAALMLVNDLHKRITPPKRP